MTRPCVLIFCLSVFCAAPARAQVSMPALPRADQVAMLVDMLQAIKTSVVQRRRGQELATYKTVSLRLAQCAAAFGTLARDVSTDSVTRGWYGATLDVYAKASVALYPGNGDAYNRDIANMSDAIIKMKSNQQVLFYFLRNCKDFSDPKPQSVDNAIMELGGQ